MPFLGEEELYAENRFDEPWNGPTNSQLAHRIPDVYRCPSFAKSREHHPVTTENSAVMCNYVAVTDAGSVFSGENPVSKKEITDDEAQVVLLVESRRHSVIWTKPNDVGLEDLVSKFGKKNPKDPNNVRHNHTAGMHALLADGTVRFITENVNRKTLRNIILRADGEEVGGF